MANKRSTWLIGCSVGCGAIVLVGVLAVTLTSYYLRDFAKGFDSAVKTRQSLDERFGDVGEFTPWTDGVVPGERLEVFLAVREATAPAREQIEQTLARLMLSEERARKLDDEPALDKVRFVLGMVKSGFGLGSELGSFFDERNRALLDRGMGMGEYTYLYVLVYDSWLGHSPGDGPEGVRVDADSGAGGDGGYHIQRSAESGTAPTEWAQPRIHENLVSMLRNQLAAISAQSGDDSDPAWSERLAAELEKLEADRHRVPWQDGLPEVTAASFEPFRDRLEAAYSPVTNPFELGRNRKQGFSIQAD